MKKIGQRGEANPWRVCYQRGLPFLVCVCIDPYLYIFLSYNTKIKLDGVCPVDNRTSTNYLHQFVKKKKIHMTHDMTCDK